MLFWQKGRNMKRFYEKLNYFSNTEKIIWTVSVCLIAVSHIVFGGG